jgi:hypothetical protein
MGMYTGAAGWILCLGLNSLPVCYCNTQPAGLRISLDAQLMKDNLHNWLIKDNLHIHVNVKFTILVFGVIVG